MSDEYGSASINPTPIIYQDSHASDPDNYYIKNYASALGSPITLVAEKYYYMEFYHVNSGGPGFVKVSVSVPNTDPQLGWQVH